MTATDAIEPYAVRLTLEGRLQSPVDSALALLTDVAERCCDAGASLIGHVKCHCRTEGGNFHCSLTSLSSGARCSGPPIAFKSPATWMDVDVAVLVYGLRQQTIDDLTRASLRKLGETEAIDWAIEGACDRHRHISERSTGEATPSTALGNEAIS